MIMRRETEREQANALPRQCAEEARTRCLHARLRRVLASLPSHLLHMLTNSEGGWTIRAFNEWDIFLLYSSSLSLSLSRSHTRHPV